MSSELTEEKQKITPEFSFKYEEDKQVLIDLCEIFHQEKCEMSTLIAVALGGAALLVIELLYANPGGGTASGLAFFLVKYLCLWAAVFFAADIVARTFFHRLMIDTAIGDAEELYKVRILKREKPMVVKVQFFEDKIVNDTGSKQAVFLCSNVRKILETDKAIGFLVKNGPGPKNFFGVPKRSIGEDKEQELKTFLLEKCPQIKKIKKI